MVNEKVQTADGARSPLKYRLANGTLRAKRWAWTVKLDFAAGLLDRRADGVADDRSSPQKSTPAMMICFRRVAALFLVLCLESPLEAWADAPDVPVIEGDWWQVAYSPKLPEIESAAGAVVDHCFFKAANERWQLWTQIRGTSRGRIFYRWEGGEIFDRPDWTPKGICWFGNPDFGESETVIQAPCVFVEDGRFTLFLRRRRPDLSRHLGGRAPLRAPARRGGPQPDLPGSRTNRPRRHARPPPSQGWKRVPAVLRRPKQGRHFQDSRKFI